jgi:TolA-binding protein
MKRTQRHQLKENAVALAVARAKESFEAHRNEFTIMAIGVIVVLAAVGGYFYWRQGVDTSSRALLAEAMAIADAQVVPPAAAAAPGSSAATPAAPPPGTFTTDRAKQEAALSKFMAAANAYPSTPAGIAARYQAAATLMALGRTAEAIQRFQEVIDRAPTTVYAETAHLGLAEAQATEGQFDAALATFRSLASQQESPIPIDGVLMQMGRTYLLAGRVAEARQTFQRIVDEFPQSAFATVARKALEESKTEG